MALACNTKAALVEASTALRRAAHVATRGHTVHLIWAVTKDIWRRY